MKLEDALETFLDGYEKDSTRRAYEGVLRPFVAAIGPKRSLDIIAPIDIQQYVNDLKQRHVKYSSHSRRPEQAGGLSSFTIRKHIKSIRRFFNWMVQLELLDRSPVKVQDKRLEQLVPREKMATTDEVELIVRACFGHVRNYALVLFIADTACRAGGAATLRLGNLNLGGYEAFVTEKGDKTRPVWFGEETKKALERWLSLRPDADNDYVFCATRKPYGNLTSESVSNVIERAALAAGIERPIHSHALRHWKADILSQTTDVNTASMILGHSDSETTMDFYFRKDTKRARAAIDKTSYHPPKSNNQMPPTDNFDETPDQEL